MKKQKKSKKDCNRSNLPHNRFEVFFDCIKQRYDVLALCGILILISSIPFVTIKIFSIMAIQNMDSNEISQFLTISSLIEIPLTLLIAVAISGCVRVIKRLIWAEPIIFWFDFKEGVKQNYKYYIATTAILSVLNYLNSLTFATLDSSLINRIPSLIFITIIVPISLYTYSQSAVYNEKYSKLLSNGLLIYIKTVPISLLFSLLLSSVQLIVYIPIVSYQIIAWVLVFFFLCPMYMMAWLLYSFNKFDKLINQYQYPEIVGKGIWSNEDNENNI